MTTATKYTGQQIIEQVAHFIAAKFDYVNGYTTYGEFPNLVDFTYDQLGQGAVLEDEIHQFVNDLAPDKGFTTSIWASDRKIRLELE